MTHTTDRDRSMSAVKRALVAIETMQAKLDAIEAARYEPLAIVGMACRYPGGADRPEAFWQLLHDGEDAIADVPADRWDAEALYDPDPDAPGKIATRKGGFLDDIDRFDAQFFGISAREARSLDPQQRLLLETSWEALERANCPPQSLANTDTGVFVGICSNDYGKALVGSGDRSNIDAFYGTSNAISVAAGRVSYVLGLRGPSLSVDTACSSSLVAVHLACQSLRNGECSTAIAAGVNVLLSPETSIAFSRAHMLDADGRCRTFDASASGYSRGEGCGAIVLKRLSDAERDGDRVLALIRGTAVNHNGRSSSLMSPNGLAQQAVIRAALDSGRVDPARVSYVEVQGTGTALGEPIEVGALAATYGQNRPADRPLTVGTVKTNIGHLEGGAGIASLIKVVLAMQHRTIPPHLNVTELNPNVEWERIPVKVGTERLPWLVPADERRLAGVSAFGFGGTNAHAILEEAPVFEPVRSSDRDRSHHLFTLSAKTPAALQQLARKYAEFLPDQPDDALAHICHSANVGRSHFAHRFCAVANTTSQLQQQVAAYGQGEVADGARVGRGTEPPKLAFLFGQAGSLPEGAVRHLYDTQPAFRQSLDRCADLLAPQMTRPLLEVIESDAAFTCEPASAQPALFAFEYALAQMWRSWGIEPAAVVGLEVGEYVAACVADIFTLEDALRLAIERGRSLSDTSPENSVEKPPETFARALEAVTFHKPAIAIASSITGTRADTEMAAADYWRREASQPTRFTEAIAAVAERDIDAFLDVSPGATAIAMGRECLADWQGQWLPSVTSSSEVWVQLLDSLSAAYVAGATPDWESFDRPYPRQKVELPTYAWQKQRYWFESAPQQAAADPRGETDPTVETEKRSDREPNAKTRAKPTQVKPSKASRKPARSAPAAKPAASRKTKTLAPLTNEAEIRAWAIAQIAEELGVDPSSLDPDVPFDSYGLDSVLAIGIASAAKQRMPVDVTPLMLARYPTIATLSEYLARQIDESDVEVFEI
ncbi:MAG: beta-ketoacyl synthase N-terminal-like domain-containing protein [Cyanobacteria bacterium J06639_1]